MDFDVNKENEKLIINNSGALVCFVGTVRGNSENSEEHDEPPLSAKMWEKANEEPIVKEKIVEKKVYVEKEESGWSQLFKWIGILTVIIILFRMCAG